MKIINYEIKKEIMLTNVQIKIIRKNLNHTVKSEIIVIMQENIEELLIVVAICVIKYQKRFL